MSDRITIDFDAIYEIARKGINRAAVFMGLGVNAADNEDMNDYLLTRDTTFNILPIDASPETVSSWKTEFRRWVVGCGFREMVDRLCVYFDKIHLALRLIDKSNTEQNIQNFEYLGLRKKIDALSDDLGFTFKFSEQLSTFTDARNCFVHRLGHVEKIDLKYSDPLVLRFMRFDCVFIPESGDEINIPDLFDPNSPSYTTPEAGCLGLKWTEKQLEYRENEWIDLNPKDLTEILYFTLRCIADVHQETINFAKSKGLQIIEKKK